jgi:hypothetical protein
MRAANMPLITSEQSSSAMSTAPSIRANAVRRHLKPEGLEPGSSMFDRLDKARIVIASAGLVHASRRSPIHRNKLIANVRSANNLYRCCGRNIEARRQIARLSGEIGQAMDFGPWEILCEASAHGRIRAQANQKAFPTFPTGAGIGWREWGGDPEKEKPGHWGRVYSRSVLSLTRRADDQYLATTGAGAPQLK